MKLDHSVIYKIAKVAAAAKTNPGRSVDQFLTYLDLVFKPGDASQSILVENCPKNDKIDWLDLYNKEK